MPKARSENYDYKLPEGYEWHPELRQRFDALVDEAGLDELTAQRFLDLHVEMMEEYATNLEKETENVEHDEQKA